MAGFACTYTTGAIADLLVKQMVTTRGAEMITETVGSRTESEGGALTDGHNAEHATRSCVVVHTTRDARDSCQRNGPPKWTSNLAFAWPTMAVRVRDRAVHQSRRSPAPRDAAIITPKDPRRHRGSVDGSNATERDDRP